ncbi:hypothetical protein AX16_002890 [Volvariella volvacea WC 439]|nr:hypothetical protein AX16_002890 [Volvariella volvacea WC 439]
MEAILSPIIQLYRYSLQPIAPFTWFGLGISSLDIVGGLRLCIILRQLREDLHVKHVAKKGGKETVEDPSFMKNLATTLMVVYGGEAVTAPLLGMPPSFMLSGLVPGLYAGIQAIVDNLPFVPPISAGLELPLSLLDGFTRAILVCTLIPSVIINHTSPAIAESPWTLLLSSLMVANGGFFFVNTLNLLGPTTWTVQTPPELRAYGWTTADLWCAPAATALYSLLTHAQPFWAELHLVIVQILGGATGVKGIEPVDPEVARALCALLLSGLFFGRTVKNFGGLSLIFPKTATKIKTQ